jgi:hypothetical protein
MTKDLRIVIILLLWVAATGCNGCFGLKPPTEQPGSTLPRSCDEMQPELAAQKLDVLFVIDNSGSMREEQEGVARELTSFVSELRVAGGVDQDIRVGVITTSVYQHSNSGGFPFFADCQTRGIYCTQSGKLQPVPDANPDGGGVLLGTGSERILEGTDPELVAKFARLVQQGTSGSGQETPFEALRLALFDWQQTPLASGGNGGFLRDGARLLLVTLTDEDDCSEKFTRPSKVLIADQPDVNYCGQQASMLTPVSEYFDIFRGLKNADGTTKEIIYTTIGPVGISTKQVQEVLGTIPLPGGGVAMYPDGGVVMQVRNIDCPTSIQPGFRHRAMAEMFYSDLSNLDSICKSNYRDTLIAIANLAGVSQSLDLTGVPDPGVLQIIIERKDGSKKLCTIDNGGITADDRTETGVRVHFGPDCKRRRDDLSLKIEQLCIY